MGTFPWAAATSRTTGISSQSIANGAGYVGSEIDNSTNLDDTMDLELVFSCTTAPNAFNVVYLYILYSLDGTNYEDGSSSLQPTISPLAVGARNVTTSQRVALTGVPISPHKFKIMAWNALGQTAVATVTCKTYRKGYAS